jgi:hypothetical protein
LINGKKVAHKKGSGKSGRNKKPNHISPHFISASLTSPHLTSYLPFSVSSLHSLVLIASLPIDGVLNVRREMVRGGEGR